MLCVVHQLLMMYVQCSSNHMLCVMQPHDEYVMQQYSHAVRAVQ